MSVWNGTFSSDSFSTSAGFFSYFCTEPPNEVQIFDWWDYYYTTVVLLTLWEVGQWVKMSVGQARRGTAWDSFLRCNLFFFNNPQWPGALGSKILSGAIYEHVIAASALFCWGTYEESGKEKEKRMTLSNDQTLFTRNHRLLDHFPTRSRWYLGQPDVITSTKSDVFSSFPSSWKRIHRRITEPGCWWWKNQDEGNLV